MIITSRRNGALKNMRRLLRCKGDHAVLEGPHLVAEALTAGLALEEVLATPELLATAEGEGLAESLGEAGVTPKQVAAGVLRGFADADSPQGLVAVARLPRPRVDGLPRLGGGVYVFVEGLQDPGNLGALTRAAEAAGAAGLALSAGTVHPNHPRALRASAASLLRLPTAVEVTPEALEEHLTSLAPRWLALAPRGGEGLYEAELEGTVVLALGGEGAGLSPELLGRIGQRLTIPMAPPVESLNATVAASLVLFEIRRRRS